MFKEGCKRLDRIGYKENRSILNILAIDGSQTKAFTSAMINAAGENSNDFAVSVLRDAMKASQQTSSTSPAANLYTIIKTGSDGAHAPRIILLPLARPKLQPYWHYVFADPHNEYLQNYTTIHRDGTCHVIKLNLGPSWQLFSASSVSIMDFSVADYKLINDSA